MFLIQECEPKYSRGSMMTLYKEGKQQTIIALFRVPYSSMSMES